MYTFCCILFSCVSGFSPNEPHHSLKKNVERSIQCKVCSGKNGKKKFVDLRTEMVIEITFLGKFILNN